MWESEWVRERERERERERGREGKQGKRGHEWEGEQWIQGRYNFEMPFSSRITFSNKNPQIKKISSPPILENFHKFSQIPLQPPCFLKNRKFEKKIEKIWEKYFWEFFQKRFFLQKAALLRKFEKIFLRKFEKIWEFLRKIWENQKTWEFEKNLRKFEKIFFENFLKNASFCRKEHFWENLRKYFWENLRKFENFWEFLRKQGGWRGIWEILWKFSKIEGLEIFFWKFEGFGLRMWFLKKMAFQKLFLPWTHCSPSLLSPHFPLPYLPSLPLLPVCSCFPPSLPLPLSLSLSLTLTLTLTHSLTYSVSLSLSLSLSLSFCLSLSAYLHLLAPSFPLMFSILPFSLYVFFSLSFYPHFLSLSLSISQSLSFSLYLPLSVSLNLSLSLSLSLFLSF